MKNIFMAALVAWSISSSASARSFDSAINVGRLTERYANNMQRLMQVSLQGTGVEFSYLAKSLAMAEFFNDPTELILWPVPDTEYRSPSGGQIEVAEKMGLEIVTISNKEHVRTLVFLKEYTPERQIERAFLQIEAGEAKLGGKLLDIESGVTVGEILALVDFRQPDWSPGHVHTAIHNYVKSHEKYRMEKDPMADLLGLKGSGIVVRNQ